MLKREKRRTFRKITSAIFIVAFAVVALVGIFLLFKTGSKLLNLSSENGLIRPLGQMTTVSILKQKISDKNIILDSLVESSSSAVIVGVVRDGPKVLFSETLDPGWEAESLSLILQRTTVDNKKPTLIDLTTNRPIVKF